MTRLSKSLLSLAFAWLAILVVAAPLAAQTITTGSLSGTVSDDQGGRLPGATVTAMHKATGTTYSTITQSDGHYSILNVRVGEYTLKVTLSSFKDAGADNVVVALGEDKVNDFKLPLATVAETITVTATTPPIDLSRAGAGGSVSNEVKELLPTIQRSLTDIARTNPYFNPMGRNDDELTASVAGRSQRYNSLQIDGAVNTDLFGLAAGGGVPGGQAGSQPISFDAIQELQLVVSPYDIRQGGFSGGGINAITKSGSNDFHGSVFLYGRNQDWVGEFKTTANPTGKIGTFSDKQAGFSLGGPIQRNKAFFFVNLDDGRKNTPSGFSVNGTGQAFGNEAQVDRILNAAKNKYGYDVGPNAKSEVIRDTNSDKFFARADFNLGIHQLTVRHNYVNAQNDSGFPSLTSYVFPDGFHNFTSRTNSTVAQLTSRVWQGVNEFRFTTTSVREKRNIQDQYDPFPRATITVVGSTLANLGLDGPSQRNELDQDIMELTDDFTKVYGTHQITVGTHNEFFKIRNLFINGAFGQYTFQSIDLFEQGLAQRYQYVYSNTSDPLQAAKFNVRHFGFYAGDQWRPSSRLTLTYGARMDIQRFPTIPNRNPVSEDRFGYRTDEVPNGTTFSPRAGFNYALKDDGSEQVRGGIGLFSGRTPYVWISNQYGNTGVDFIRLDTGTNAASRIPFIPDPNNQYRTLANLPGFVGNAAPLTNEIDLIDPDFKYPSVIRANIAYDRKLPWGIYGTAEVIFTPVVNDVKFQNLNLVQTGTVPVDGRPVYARKYTDLTDVILLTNTSEGNAWTIAFEGKKPFSKGFFVNASYLYGQSTAVVDGVRDQALSAWGNVFIGGDPNNPPVGTSDYDPGHRITISGSYDFHVWKEFSASASLYYSGQSGRPYSLLWGSPGVNGDQQTLNDLLYLPEATDTLTYTNGTYADLRAYLDKRQCTAGQIGEIMERNSCRSPWSNTMDARFTVNLPFKKVKAEVTMDILNLINFFDADHGYFRYASSNFITPVAPITTGGVVTGMNLGTLTNSSFSEFTRNDLRSRWQFQLGARLRF